MGMKKSTGLVLLLCVVAVMFVVSCVKQVEIVIPSIPSNLRITALVGVAGVELRWDAVDGAASYDVTLTRVDASGSREIIGTYNTTNTYYLVTRDNVGAGSFNWSVSAKNTAGSSAGKPGDAFTLEPEPEPDPIYGLILTLVETPDLSASRDVIPEIHILDLSESSPSGERLSRGADVYNLNFLTAHISYEQIFGSESRENMSVQLMVEKVGSGVAKRWPDSDTEFLLDEEGELVFGVNNLGNNFTPNLEPGNYYLWARAAWDISVQSTKKPFIIVELNETLDASIKVYNQDTEYSDKVCGLATEVELDYEVSITDGGVFDELFYSFVIAQLGSDASESVTLEATFAGETEFATTVTYATECTKYATLTLDGTLTRVFWDDVEKEATEVQIGLMNILINEHVFVLDLADPTALLTLELPAGFSSTEPASLTNATLTFLASDTKCLQPYDEKITFEVYVEKGISSWFEEFAFFDEEIILGDNSVWNNEITIIGTYNASKTSSTNPDEAEAILLFDIPIMDYATVTATMSVHDCCCLDCMVELGPCEEPDTLLSHATEVSTQFVVDNVFFSSLLEDDDIFVYEGFLGEAANPLIPASPTQATLTVKFADALWSEAEWENINWAVYDSDWSLFSALVYDPIISATSLTTGVCSGWATKTEVTFTGTLTADSEEAATETSLTLIATAVDATGNEFYIELPFLFDTLPPTLTHFTAFRDQYNNHSWVEFKFDQEPESAELAIVTNGGTFEYDLDDAEPIGGIPNAYRMETGITLPYSSAVTLNATATDLAGNIGFSTKTNTVSLSESR
jgi:hypothetical protein